MKNQVFHGFHKSKYVLKNEHRGYPEGFENHELWQNSAYVKILIALLEEDKDEDLPNIGRMLASLCPALMEEGYSMNEAGFAFNLIGVKYQDVACRAWMGLNDLPEMIELFESLKPDQEDEDGSVVSEQ